MAVNATFLEDDFWVEAVAATAPYVFVASHRTTMIGDFPNGVGRRCSVA